MAISQSELQRRINETLSQEGYAVNALPQQAPTPTFKAATPFGQSLSEFGKFLGAANTVWTNNPSMSGNPVQTNLTAIGAAAGASPAPTPVTQLPSTSTGYPVNVGQTQTGQVFDAQRQSLSSQLTASRQAVTGAAETQQRQLAMAMQQAQRDYNLQRQQLAEQSFLQQRQLQQAAQARGLGQSGLAQLAQIQQGMQQGQLVNQAAQGMQQTRLGYNEQARSNQQTLANQLLQLEANKQAGEANIGQQQLQMNLSLQDKARAITTDLLGIARSGQQVTDEVWNLLAAQYGIDQQFLAALKKIYQETLDAQ